MTHNNEGVEQSGDNGQGRNRRRFTRIDFDSSVEFRYDGTALRAVSPFNVSLGGIRARVEAPLPVGAQCDISIFFNGAASDLRIDAQGRVIRNEEVDGSADSGGASSLGEMVLIFTSISDDGYFHLRNLILYNSTDPELVEAEF